MDALFNRENIFSWLQTIQQWINTHLIVWDNFVQVLALLLIRLVGSLLGKPVSRFFKQRVETYPFPHILLKSFVQRLTRLVPLLLSIMLLWIAIQIFQQFDINVFIMKLVLNLSVAWIIVQLAASIILVRFWSRLIAVLVWALAALNILGVFGSVISLLENNGISIGQTRLTVLSILQTAVVLLVLLRIVNWINGHVEQRLTNIPGLNSSTRLMLAKISHITMIVLVTLIVLNSLGIDFTSLALFSGAIGVGVGFGLQKVVGNYISGLILLSDKSIKPGDVIQLGDVYGWVRNMGGRYVSIVTRDEKEYLIPNEDLITQQVINWSYSNRTIRLKVGLGISYKSDPHQAIELIEKSVESVERVLKQPPPRCLLKGFGDSSIDLELRFWIDDPINGISNVNSDVYLKIWDTLKENGIEIPFPQRDIHLQSN